MKRRRSGQEQKKKYEFAWDKGRKTKLEKPVCKFPEKKPWSPGGLIRGVK